MSYSFYKLMHYSGIFMILMVVGAYAAHYLKSPDKPVGLQKKVLGVAHGVSLLLILTGGFGLLARLGIKMSEPWILGKLGIWLFFGLSTLLLRRGSPGPVAAGLYAAAFLAAVLGHLKP